MFKKLTIVLLLLLIVFSVAACADKDAGVVTNLSEQSEEKTVMASEKEGHLDNSEGENPEATAAGDSRETAAARDKEDTASAGASDKEPVAADNKEPPQEQAGVSLDRELYKGYQGPVQGEIKYQEGTPADANSGSYQATGDIESPYQVNLVVTQNYGHTKMFGRKVGLVKDEVGMEVMFRNLDIQTAYGGGFVNAINGVESKYTFYTGAERKKLDWFYWVNGILAPVGVAEYRPQPGDEIWWDYHNWDVTMFIPAVIGSYPQPFKSGFWGKNPGTVIMYTEPFKEGAQKLKQSLLEQGVKEIDVAAYNPSVLENPDKYYILLGTWGELSADSESLQKTNLKGKFIGVYIKFADGKMQALNLQGQTVKTFDDTAGAIYAFAPGIGSVKPTWLVTGTGNAGVQSALDVLLDDPSSITQFFGAVVTKNGVENVPFMN
ncbi:protein of unknown function [Desulfotomaculum arcticum]|uniref:Transcobalamin-like C-terminal domain-containing protein n=1 Tax=Desulfotruncus arcticus DSM 17038 TaxID=1121424 RepID=A0A1I2SWG5_9FIRM|nr:DUF4430 domain-containing protein [Desulfotruncus arcticus]SFG57215.1 protein of unknown function [Desulfotomaculum arcticum] [Desulfotruncus arcticus DSM 17038]